MRRPTDLASEPRYCAPAVPRWRPLCTSPSARHTSGGAPSTRSTPMRRISPSRCLRRTTWIRFLHSVRPEPLVACAALCPAAGSRSLRRCLHPTYNEPLSVLKPTVLAALSMRYPHQTYVLDDGRRDEVRRFCAEVGVEYLTRPDNRGARRERQRRAPPTGGSSSPSSMPTTRPSRSFLPSCWVIRRPGGRARPVAPGVLQPRLVPARPPQTLRREALARTVDLLRHDHAGEGPHERGLLVRIERHSQRAALEEVGGVNTLTVTGTCTRRCSCTRRVEVDLSRPRTCRRHCPGRSRAFPRATAALGPGRDGAVAQRHSALAARLSWRQRVAYFTSVAYVIEYVPKAIYLSMPPLVLITGVLP